MGDQATAAEGADELPLGPEAEGEEAEAAGALHVGGHDLAAAVGAASWGRVTPQHSLLHVAQQHQAHLSLSPSCARAFQCSRGDLW